MNKSSYNSTTSPTYTMALVKRNSKYTIIHSSYLENLVTFFKLVRYNITDDTINLAPNDPDNGFAYLSDNVNDYELKETDPRPLFIRPSKDVIYASPDLDNEKHGDILKMLAIETSNNPYMQMIVFENKGRQPFFFAKFIGDLEYCACFSIIDVKLYFRSLNLFAVVLEADDEGG